MGKLYIFGNTKTAILNPETLIVEDEINGVGCIGPKAIQSNPTGLFWFDQNNIYSANPQIRKIGTPILKQETQGWTILSDSVKASAVSGYDSNRNCYLVYFTNGSDHRVWSYYITTSRWDLWETDYTVYDSVQSSDGYPILLMENGRISKHLGGNNKRDWVFESKKLSFGTGTTVRKKLKAIKVDDTSRSQTSVSYKTNDNNASWQSGTDISSSFTGSNNSAVKLATADKGKQHWIKMQVAGENDTAGSNVKAHALSAIYKPKRPK